MSSKDHPQSPALPPFSENSSRSQSKLSSPAAAPGKQRIPKNSALENLWKAQDLKRKIPWLGKNKVCGHTCGGLCLHRKSNYPPCWIETGVENKSDGLLDSLSEKACVSWPTRIMTTWQAGRRPGGRASWVQWKRDVTLARTVRLSAGEGRVPAELITFPSGETKTFLYSF